MIGVPPFSSRLTKGKTRMTQIRIARPHACRKHVKFGLTIGDLVRLTALIDGELTAVSLPGNSAQRRKLRRQVVRAIKHFSAGVWLVGIHRPRRSKSHKS